MIVSMYRLRLIDADKLFPDCMTKNGTLAISQSQIANAPTVEERPKGKWMKEDKPWGGFGDSVLVNTCPFCKESFVYHGNDPKFCSNCGAEMVEEVTND